MPFRVFSIVDLVSDHLFFCPNRNCRAIFCLRFRRSPSLPAITSTASAKGAEWMAAGTARVAFRGHDHAGAAAAVAHRSSRSPAAGQHSGGGDFQRRSRGDSHPDRCRPFWRQAHAGGDDGPSGDHAVVHLWSWPFFGLPALSTTKKNIRLLDAAYSALPLAAIISQIAKPNEVVAVYRVRRDVEYGFPSTATTRWTTISRRGFPQGSTSDHP